MSSIFIILYRIILVRLQTLPRWFQNATDVNASVNVTNLKNQSYHFDPSL